PAAVAKQAGVPAVGGGAVPGVQGVGGDVVPRRPDWPSHAVMAGYWFLEDEDWRPPSSLEEFLSAGRPPIYIGFGSVAGRQAEGLPPATVPPLPSRRAPAAGASRPPAARPSAPSL